MRTSVLLLFFAVAFLAHNVHAVCDAAATNTCLGEQTACGAPASPTTPDDIQKACTCAGVLIDCLAKQSCFCHLDVNPALAVLQTTCQNALALQFCAVYKTFCDTIANQDCSATSTPVNPSPAAAITPSVTPTSGTTTSTPPSGGQITPPVTVQAGGFVAFSLNQNDFISYNYQISGDGSYKFEMQMQFGSMKVYFSYDSTITAPDASNADLVVEVDATISIDLNIPSGRRQGRYLAVSMKDNNNPNGSKGSVAAVEAGSSTPSGGAPEPQSVPPTPVDDGSSAEPPTGVDPPSTTYHPDAAAKPSFAIFTTLVIMIVGAMLV